MDYKLDKDSTAVQDSGVACSVQAPCGWAEGQSAVALGTAPCQRDDELPSA